MGVDERSASKKTAEEFWADIDRQPKDWSLRLIFSDWLSELPFHDWRDPLVMGMRWMAREKKKFPFRPSRSAMRLRDIVWRRQHVPPRSGPTCTLEWKLWWVYKGQVEGTRASGRGRRYHEMALSLALWALWELEQEKALKEGAEVRTRP